MQRQRGFTLVEIAIVLVIIGLILGGVLKGQELIDSARVRTISNDMSGMRSAWFAFQDRYRAIPGDFSRASTQIAAGLADGNGDGKVKTAAEAAGVWQQLVASGFISGQYDGSGGGMSTVTGNDCSTSTCPQNPYNGFYKIAYGNKGTGNTGEANEMYTGDQIPVNIILQLDLKVDDGVANAGDLRLFNTGYTTCATAENWNIANNNQNCAAVFRHF